MLKKKMTNARMCRVKALIAATLVGIMVPVVGVFGSNEVTKNVPYRCGYTTKEAYLHIYLNFEKFNCILLPDLVWCNMMLMGTRRLETSAVYRVETDLNVVDVNHLDKFNPVMEYVEEKGGIGAHYARVYGGYGESLFDVRTK